MKKMLKVFGIIAVVLCIFISVVACDNTGKKDVEVVAVSESEYATVEDAMKGYVNEELAFSIDGVLNGTQVVIAEYVSHESKGEVSVKLSEEQKTGFVSAEKIAVKAKVAMGATGDKDPVFSDVTQTVYALNYGEKYKYMVSVPEVGERVTNSYVKMLTSASKYENCTINGVTKNKEEDEETPAFGRGTEYKFTTEATSSFIYRDETRYNNRTPGGDDNDYDIRMYIAVNDDNALVAASYMRILSQEKWLVSPLDFAAETVKEYNEYMFETQVFSNFKQMPAALYTKTATGFEYTYSTTEDDETLTVVCKYTESSGRIVNINMYMTNTWTDEDDGTEYIESYEEDITIGSFGSTIVTIPDEVNDEINK